MAERRMLTKKVTDDDNFMSLSSSAQALYLHLSMSADDDGFCNQVAISMFKAHASVQDLQALLEKRYIYQFDNGVIVIKHWRMANALRKDRYTPTAFQEELAMLGIKDNGAYTWLPDGCQVVATCLPQDSVGKSSVVEGSKGEGNDSRKRETTHAMYLRLLPDYIIHDRVNDKMVEWLKYKTERKDKYTETGLKALLRRVENTALTYGDDAMIALIDDSIANGWKGIMFDRLSKQQQATSDRNKRSGGIDFRQMWDEERGAR